MGWTFAGASSPVPQARTILEGGTEMKRPASLFLVLIAITASCYYVDSMSLFDKMYTKCRVLPLVPSCAAVGGDEDVLRYAFDLEMRNVVNNPFEAQCIRDVDCSQSANLTQAYQEIGECMNMFKRPRLDRDPECLNNCAMEYTSCGPERCGMVEVRACRFAFDACRRFCPPTL